MQLPRIAGTAEAATALLASLLLITPAAAALDCKRIVINGQKFDLGELRGPHSVVTTLETPPSVTNTSYTVDICNSLKRKDDVPKNEQCEWGTNVCAIRRIHEGDKDVISEVRQISFTPHAQPPDWNAEFLRDSGSNTDADRDGIRLFLRGGVYQKVKQQAVIEFVCDPNMDGTEQEWTPEDEYERDVDNDGRRRSIFDRRDDDDDDNKHEHEGTKEKQLIKDGAALKFLSYGHEQLKDPKFDGDVLRLEWRTKYACKKRNEDGSSGDGDQSSHWGFFTWLIVIVFLGVSAYLIFGSWLNYTRYGARGWDLVPHGDAIRDIPYLMKDWTRSVLNTVQGSGTRGGYSAV